MIYKIFANHAMTTPEATAIVTSDGQLFTYRAALERVHQRACYFLKHGIKSGDRVGVLLNNEDHHVFILLALDRINATYVPFDTEIPIEQLSHDIQTLKLQKFLIEQPLDYPINPELKLVLANDDLFTSDHVIDLQAIPYIDQGLEKITYIVSSSGTTGDKKWIPITGVGLLYWADVVKSVLDLTSGYRMLATRSPAYDARIYEYICAFAAGGSLYLLDKSQRKDLSSILACCEKASISGLLFIASQLGTQNTQDVVARLKQYGLNHLMVTGDSCTPYLKALCEQYDLNLVNGYGPTEATFGMSLLVVNGMNSHESIVPIGKPYGDAVHYHILDNKLYIESPYLTPGYINQTDTDTAFKSLVTETGEIKRLFDTGDSFLEQNGLLYYQGRFHAEGHCKVNGVKITPLYIERCLQAYNQSNFQAAVVIKSYLGQDKPHAYIVVSPDFNVEQFMLYLKQHLKKEEVPVLIRLDKLPRMSPSDKIDRQALIKRCDQHDEMFRFNQPVEPRVTANQHVIKAIWQDILQHDTLPENIEFMFLGGDSIRAMEMVRRIKQELDPNYSYISLLNLEKITIQTVADSLIMNTTQSADMAFIHALKIAGNNNGNIFCLPALLGEGYFSYRNVAQTLHQKFNKSIYGLSDPGITDEALLPETFEQAINRYVRAIKTIQPAGPYELFGFSFGSTLAFEVAKKLKKQGEWITDIHLVDGFPPYLYQTLSDEAHVELLQSLLNFLVDTLKNRFYSEELNAVKLEGFAKLSKSAQVQLGFESIEKKLKNPASKSMINMAKTHLSFMLTAQKPQKKQYLWPRFYLTTKAQPYLDVINHIPNLSRHAADYRFYYWNRYSENITRCGIELDCTHLGVLQYNGGLSRYWQRSHDFIFNVKIDFGPEHFYRFQNNGKKTQLALFCVKYEFVESYVNDFNRRGLSTMVSLHEKQFEKHQQKDIIYSAQANIFCTIPNDKMDGMKAWAKAKASSGLREIGATNRVAAVNTIAKEYRQKGTIDLIIYQLLAPLISISFHFDSIPEAIIASIQKKLGLSPVQRLATHLGYAHFSTFTGTSTFDALENASDFLGDFITVLHEHLEQPVYTREAPHF